MSEDKPVKMPDALKTLTEEELDRVEVLSPEKIHEALRKAQEDFRKCQQRYAIFPRYR